MSRSYDSTYAYALRDSVQYVCIAAVIIVALFCVKSCCEGLNATDLAAIQKQEPANDK